jgi:hypothetical protein
MNQQDPHKMAPNLKRPLAVAGMGALVTMALLTGAINDQSGATNGPMIVADTTTSTTPPSTPTAASAAPTLKASPFQGGDWPSH